MNEEQAARMEAAMHEFGDLVRRKTQQRPDCLKDIQWHEVRLVFFLILEKHGVDTLWKSGCCIQQ